MSGTIDEVEVKESTCEEKPRSVKPEKEIPPVSFLSLFQYSSKYDKLLIGIGTAVALLTGTSKPAVLTIYGKVINQLITFDFYIRNETAGNYTVMPNSSFTTEEFLGTTANLCMLHALFGCILFIGNYISITLFSLAAANQTFRIRCQFMEAVLRQDMAWFDTHQTGDFVTKITGDLTLIQEGVGEKVAICLYFVSSTLLCLGNGIYHGWKLALVILCLSPALTAAMSIISKMQAKASIQELDAYGTAGSVAEEAISSIRTVVAFGGQRKEIERYAACLSSAFRKGIKRSFFTSIGSALTWFVLFAGYALGLWYGVKLIVASMDQPEPEYTGGRVIIVFLSVTYGSLFMGQIAPYFEAFALSRSAAAKVFSIIQRVPTIDSRLDDGLRPTILNGHIQINNVHFNYPARPNVPVLKDVNLELAPGETVALVGSSGCGKSTIVQLLLRFYDVNRGSIRVDGIDIRDLHLGWLRDNVGLVGQEPVLFATTIEENIRMGHPGASQSDIEKAARTANAHDFIEKLPKKYETVVGDRGIQLSGGQKQRIAIARAVVKNPMILLLDEATSALDTDSESVVQAALDQARRGRTTLVVAHRLSTVRCADKIVVLEEGVVKETGTHEALMKVRGMYNKLVMVQTVDAIDNSNVMRSGSEKMQENTEQLNRRMSKNISVVQEREKEEGGVEPNLSKRRLCKIFAQEWPYILVGSISAVFIGIHYPVFGIFFGEILGVLTQSSEVIENTTSFFCLLISFMAITSSIFNFLQIFMFSLASEKLSIRLRKLVFENIVSQDISFFDEARNSVGSLCSRLNSDASSVQGATGSRISMPLQALSTLTMSVFIALIYNWNLGLVVLAFIPLMLLGPTLEAKVVRGQMIRESDGMEEASKLATEAIENIRTVASLNQEVRICNQYRSALLDSYKKSRIKSHVRGLVYGFAQGMQTWAYASTLFYGSILVSRREIEYGDLLKVLQGVLVSIIMMGHVVAFTPDYEKARTAALRIFKFLDSKPTIGVFSEREFAKLSINGSVHFSNVYFAYPSRPEVEVLRGLEAVIKPGKTVALVGISGCGKSTCIQLLERFYDTSEGAVKVDSEDVRFLNVASHRSHLALVSQEPVLFGRSIAENIAYGDNTRDKIDISEIIQVANQANIHEFISSLPQGYDTPVGDRGTQLSGGQKQRIAIARALVRNPRILLLDEATSALDTESEKVVQEALDVARSGRTCLVIAHRLTTVHSADIIMVLQHGKIAEQGTHQDLINEKGIYHRLHKTQSEAGL